MVRVDVRVLSATNRNLEQEVRGGRFRADLFHRLHVFPLPVPPLRDRLQDVPLLAGAFCDTARRRLGLGPVRLATDAADALAAYAWPGNVRELENVISRAVLKAAAHVARGAPVIVARFHLGTEFTVGVAPVEPPPGVATPSGRRRTLQESVEDHKRELISGALAESGQSVAGAARLLGMDRGNLHHLAARLGLISQAARTTR